MNLDILGRAISVDSLVVYPVQTREGLVLRVATVIDAACKGELTLRTVRKNGTDYEFIFKRLDRVAIVS